MDDSGDVDIDVGTDFGSLCPLFLYNAEAQNTAAPALEAE
jgi:hypothetical protein